MKRIAGRRFLLPDGSERYLVDEALLVALTKDFGGRLEDPSEDNRGSESTLDDNVGGAERLTGAAQRPFFPRKSIRSTTRIE